VAPQDGIGVKRGQVSVAAMGTDAKVFATLAARLALKGFALHKLDSGYLITKWDRTINLATIEGVQAFADRVSGVPA